MKSEILADIATSSGDDADASAGAGAAEAEAGAATGTGSAPSLPVATTGAAEGVDGHGREREGMLNVWHVMYVHVCA